MISSSARAGSACTWWRFIGGGAGLSGGGLEGDDLERNTEDLRDLLREFSIWSHFIACPAKSSADHLLAKKLRHEGSQPDDVGDGVAIPALGQHANADDAANIAARRVKRAVELFGELRKSFRI